MTIATVYIYLQDMTIVTVYILQDMTIATVYILQDMTIVTVYIFTSGHDYSNCVYIL